MKRLTRHGNSWALVIEKPVLDLLKIDPETTPVETRTDGRNLIVAPVTDEDRARRFNAARKNSQRKYGRMYKRLANR